LRLLRAHATDRTRRETTRVAPTRDALRASRRASPSLAPVAPIVSRASNRWTKTEPIKKQFPPTPVDPSSSSRARLPIAVERRVNASSSRDDRADPVAFIRLARAASTFARLDVRAERLTKIPTINRPSGMRTMGVDIASRAAGRCDDRWIRGRGDVVSI
jgi:hypothetical protein